MRKYEDFFVNLREMSSEHKSVYVLGAEDGVMMGPLMAAAMVLFGACAYVSWLSMPALLMALAVPVVAYYRLGLAYKNNPTLTFSALWLEGICMFFFGGLVMSVVVFACLRWWVPGYILKQVETVIEFYNSMNDPQATVLADTFDKLKNSGALPSALDVALELLYFAVFSGSILSMIYSALIRRRKINAGAGSKN